MKILGLCVLHYGGEMLEAAIKQAELYCEKIIILYSSKPSFGHGTNIGCPETETDLMNIAYSASSKVEWIRVDVNGEGAHRGIIFKHAEKGGYDGILVFDADEVFGDLTEAIEQCFQSKKRNIGFSGFINFWKSFNHVCLDHFTPIRFHNLHNADENGFDVVNAPVYHFGCAQRMPIMEYKLLIHGHFAEIRKNWLEDVYKRWEPGMIIENGLHLTSHNLWSQATDFDKNTLPEILHQHHNFFKETI